MDEIHPDPHDVDMPTLPIVLFLNLGVGATSVIPEIPGMKPHKSNPEKVIKAMEDAEVGRFTASPYIVDVVADFVLETGKHIKLKKLFTGGGPVFPQTASKWLRAFPDTDIRIVYGSTEAEPISSIEASDLAKSHQNNGLSVGRIYKGCKVRIIPITQKALAFDNDEDFRREALKEGEIGEIIVTGDHVLKHYFENPAAEKANKIIVEEVVWHRTGDAGHLLDDNLFLAGRCKQLFRVDEDWSSTFLIENELAQIPGIKCGTLVKLDDILVLVVETKMRRSACMNLVGHLHHHRLQIISRIPRDPRHHSKIDYERLVEMVQKTP